MPDHNETNRRLRCLADDLKRHANMERISVSRACKDIITYCETNQASDMLMYPPRDNSFRVKKGCCIL